MLQLLTSRLEVQEMVSAFRQELCVQSSPKMQLVGGMLTWVGAKDGYLHLILRESTPTQSLHRLLQ